MNEALIDLLRHDLDAADYRAGAVRALLGAEAEAARLRGVLLPGKRALAQRGDEALATLAGLFLLGCEVSSDALELALPRRGVEGARKLGLVSAGATGYVAALSLNPVELPDPLGPGASGHAGASLHWWIVSDLDDQLRVGPARPDHVMGVGGATRSLLAQLPLGPHVTLLGGSVLDLGTGCGVVALMLAHALAYLDVQRVVATDISERALSFARANAQLNGLHGAIEFRQGDLFAPVAGERFDLIASNPPFVITPRSSGDDATRYEYRDAGLVGDALAERVVREAPNHLTPGGELICLANWESPWGQNGLDRVKSWVQSAAEGSGTLAAWIIERDRLDPVRYAETWARDGGARPGDAEFDEMIQAWLDDFSARRIVAIGLGSIRMRRLDPGAQTVQTSEELIRAEHVSDPFFGSCPGSELANAFRQALRVAEMSDEQMLDLRWQRAGGVSELRAHSPGEEAPHSIRLQTDRPIARVVQADTLLAAAVGACDGELTLGQIADALAQILEVDADACAEALTAGVRELVWFGMLAPAWR